MAESYSIKRATTTSRATRLRRTRYRPSSRRFARATRQLELAKSVLDTEIALSATVVVGSVVVVGVGLVEGTRVVEEEAPADSSMDPVVTFKEAVVASLTGQAVIIIASNLIRTDTMRLETEEKEVTAMTGILVAAMTGKASVAAKTTAMEEVHTDNRTIVMAAVHTVSKVTAHSLTAALLRIIQVTDPMEAATRMADLTTAETGTTLMGMRKVLPGRRGRAEDTEVASRRAMVLQTEDIMRETIKVAIVSRLMVVIMDLIVRGAIVNVPMKIPINSRTTTRVGTIVSDPMTIPFSSRTRIPVDMTKDLPVGTSKDLPNSTSDRLATRKGRARPF